jgi:hypothetical protein
VPGEGFIRKLGCGIRHSLSLRMSSVFPRKAVDAKMLSGADLHKAGKADAPQAIKPARHDRRSEVLSEQTASFPWFLIRCTIAGQ